MIISLGPKKSRNEFFKIKAIVPVRKNFWLNFSHTTEYGRPRATFRSAPKGIFAFMVQGTRSFL